MLAALVLVAAPSPPSGRSSLSLVPASFAEQPSMGASSLMDKPPLHFVHIGKTGGSTMAANGLVPPQLNALQTNKHRRRVDADLASLPIVYLHFHKAGGTTACEYFKAGTLRPSNQKACMCGHTFASALVAGDGAEVARIMREDGVDVCFVERVAQWPSPTKLEGLVGHVRLSTTLRDPWSRMLSNYEKDVSKYGCHGVGTLKDYASMNSRRRVRERMAKYGTDLPDSYVHSLVDRNASHFASRPPQRWQTKSLMNSSDLEAAKLVLQSFDDVLILEDDFASRMSVLARARSQPLQKTNNPYSNEGKGKEPPGCVREALEQEQELRSQLLNRTLMLDTELYNWAARGRGRD